MRKIFIWSIIMCVCLVLLTGCGKKENILTGRYTINNLLYEISYEFDENKNVNAKLVTGGYVALNETGTYQINEDGTMITLTFPDNVQNIGNMSFTLPNISGDYPLIKGEGYIQIGDMQYNKVTE